MGSPFRTLKHSTRWFFLSATLASAFFMGAAVRTVGVGAQSTFTEPTCNPLTAGPGECNVEKPVLQSTLDAQTIASVLNLGGIVNAQDAIVLQGANSQIKTSGAAAGPLINLAQGNSFNAIAASATDQPAIYGTATNNSGVYAASDTTYAFTALGVSGKAARLSGEVIIDTANAKLDVAGPVTITNSGYLSVEGDVGIGGTLDAENILVDGQPVGTGGGELTAYTTYLNQPAGFNFSLKTRFNWPTHYRVSHVYVMYDDASTTNAQWLPLASNSATYVYPPVAANVVQYVDCMGTIPTSQLFIPRALPTVSSNYRIVVTYVPAPVTCPDVLPTITLTPTPNPANIAYDTNVVLTPSNMSADVTSISYYYYMSNPASTTKVLMGKDSAAPWDPITWAPPVNGTYQVAAEVSDGTNVTVSGLVTVTVAAPPAQLCGGSCSASEFCCTAENPDTCRPIGYQCNAPKPS
jgi:hypothetical protein